MPMGLPRRRETDCWEITVEELFSLPTSVMKESPRWLIVKGRYPEALEVLRKMCRTNNTALPDDLDLTALEEVGSTST